MTSNMSDTAEMRCVNGGIRRGEGERSSYVKMLSNIANDLDLLLTDLCHLYPLQGPPTNQKPCFGLNPSSMTEDHDISPYDCPRTSDQMRNFSGSKQSLQSLSASEKTSTVDSGHDVTTPGSVSPEMPLYHVEQVVKMRSGSNSPLSVTDSDQRAISLFERLSKTHTIWLLPDVGRSGAVHLLKDRETGFFIVRRSSQKDSLALSVQHQHETCSNVDHYIIENTEHGMRLQGSAHYFLSIPHLIEFYMVHREDLPSQLLLPAVIMTAKSSKELSSLALLGQDFWQSKVSRCSSADSLAGPVLHKSTSEPINITRPAAAFPPDLPAKVKNCPPSTSLGDFSKFIIDKKHARIEEEPPPIPPKMDNLEETDAESTENTPQNGARHFVPNDADNSSCDHSDMSRHELRGYREQVDMSSKHNHGNRSKSNLYFTTSLDLLHIPETSYFRSSLEDKMSDYEDIWKSSICESDNMRNSSRCNMWTQTHDAFSRYNPRVHNDISPTQNESGISTLSSDGGSLSKNNLHKALAMSRVSEQANVSVSVASEHKVLTEKSDHVKYVEQFRDDRHQTSHTSYSRNESGSKTSYCRNESGTKTSYCRNESGAVTVCSRELGSEVTSYQTSAVRAYQQSQCVIQQSHAISRQVSPNSSTAPKTKPPPLPVLSRIKSSSTSSLSTIAHSPIYAEPADAVNLQHGQHVSVRIRRRSAPSYGHQDQNVLQASNRKQDQHHLMVPTGNSRVSQKPDLETIFSPRNVPNSDLVSESNSFVFSFGHQYQEQVKVAETRSSKRSITRSQSMKSTSESNAKVTRQRSLKEKFAKLKIDVLKFRNNENKSAASTPDKEDRRPRGETIDETLFSLEDLEKNAGSLESPTLHKFPVYQKQTSAEMNRQSCFSESSTLQDMISCAHPEFSVRPIQPLTVRNVKCVSEYDNLRNACGPPSVSGSTAGTVFCKPWDNSPLEKILHTQNGALQPAMNAEERVQRWQETSQFQTSRLSAVSSKKHESLGQMSDVPSVDSFTSGAFDVHKINQTRISRGLALSRKINSSTLNTDTLNSAHVNVALDDTQGGIILDPNDDTTSDDVTEVINTDLRERLRPIVSQSSHSNINTPGGKIREYIFRLSVDRNTTFGCTIENFIECTLESQENNPHNVMRNVRQFMTGIKNYLVKHGEGELEGLIERERAKLGANEFLNIDAIIEGALHVCVLRPVKHHIYKLAVESHTRSGSLKLMTKNIKYARTKSPEEIGIKPGIRPPKASDMELIKHHLDKMQKAYSPLKKLENLLSATSTIYQCVRTRHHGTSRGPQFMGADDFLPMLIYVLVQCGLVSAEIEADYMWGLLHPSVLTGEGGYYLTTLSSAVLVLKNFQETQETKASQHHGRLPSISDMQGFLKIAIPDELRDSIIWKTLPIRPSMNTKDVCALIAHKFKVTNPQDYGLYLLKDGEETELADSVCPQLVKGDYSATVQEVVFAYKRRAANIAWPRNLKKPAVMQDKV